MWLFGGVLFVTVMTRPEWVYAAIPLSVLLLLMTPSGLRRRIAIHGLALVVAFYAVIGAFVYSNGPERGYGAFVVIPRIVALGKIFQYHMQDEAPPKYSSLTTRIDRYLAEGDDGPYTFASMYPEVSADNWKLAGEYSRATMRRAPHRYLWNTIKAMHTQTLPLWGFGRIEEDATLGDEVMYIRGWSDFVHFQYRRFPFVAIGWLACWVAALVGVLKSSRRLRLMAAVSFVGMYQLFVSTAGGYADWPRLFITMNSARIIILFTTLFLGLAYLAKAVERRLVPRLAPAGRPLWIAWISVGFVFAIGFAASSSERDPQFFRSAVEWMGDHPVLTVTSASLLAWLTVLVWRVNSSDSRSLQAQSQSVS